MSGKVSKKGMNVAIIVAIIGLAGTIITALANSPVLLELLKNSPTETDVPLDEAQRIFGADFEDGKTSGLSFHIEDWAIVKDKSNKVLEVDTTSYPDDAFLTVATFGPADFNNGVLEFKIKYEEIGGVYTDFRLRNMAKYSLYLNGKGGNVSVSYNSDAQGWKPTLLPDSIIPFSFQTGVWYTVRLEAQGTYFTVYIDGNKLFTATDENQEYGGLEFNMDPDTKVLIDDIQVWSLDQ